MRPQTRSCGGAPVTPEGLLLLHRSGLINVLVIARRRELRLACAAEFHQASALRQGPMIVVDCGTEEELLVRALVGWSVQTIESPRVHPLWPAARGTLVLDRVTRLSAPTQNLLHDRVRRSRTDAGAPELDWCGRLISTCDESPERAALRGAFSTELLDCLDKVRVTPGARAVRGAA